MNRQQRRALGRSVESHRRDQEQAILGVARTVRANIAAGSEPIDERLALVDEFIAELEVSPSSRLVAGPALLEMRALRDELAVQAEPA